MMLRSPTLSVIGELLNGRDTLDAEIAAEKASALGRSGRAVERALAALAVSSEEERTALAYAAADAVQAFFIQREAMGLRAHGDVIRQYAIPNDVLAKVGAKR